MHPLFSFRAQPITLALFRLQLGSLSTVRPSYSHLHLIYTHPNDWGTARVYPQSTCLITGAHAIYYWIASGLLLFAALSDVMPSTVWSFPRVGWGPPADWTAPRARCSFRRVEWQQQSKNKTPARPDSEKWWFIDEAESPSLSIIEFRILSVFRFSVAIRNSGHWKRFWNSSLIFRKDLRSSSQLIWSLVDTIFKCRQNCRISTLIFE